MNQLVDNGEFREDLLYRINTIHIEVPPLRRRKDDIMPLAEHFLTKYSEKYGKPSLSITQQAKEKLTDYSWPGNIRELEHTIEKAVIMSESGKLKVHDFFSGSTVSHKADTNVVKLDEMEKKMITLAIEKNAGNIKAAANQLGITRQTLYNKMRKYGINQ